MINRQNLGKRTAVPRIWTRDAQLRNPIASPLNRRARWTTSRRSVTHYQVNQNSPWCTIQSEKAQICFRSGWGPAARPGPRRPHREAGCLCTRTVRTSCGTQLASRPPPSRRPPPHLQLWLLDAAQPSTHLGQQQVVTWTSLSTRVSVQSAPPCVRGPPRQRCTLPWPQWTPQTGTLVRPALPGRPASTECQSLICHGHCCWDPLLTTILGCNQGSGRFPSAEYHYWGDAHF